MTPTRPLNWTTRIVLTLGLALAAGCADQGGVGFPSGDSDGASGAFSDPAQPESDTAANEGAPGQDLVRCDAAASDGGIGIAACVGQMTSGGGSIGLSPGSYLIEQSIVVPSGVQIRGAGAATVLTAAPGLDAPVFVVGSTDESPSGVRTREVVLSDFSIEGARTDQSTDSMASAPWISVSGVVVRYASQVQIRDVSIAQTAGSGLVIDADSQFVLVERVQVEESGFDGVAVTASAQVQLTRVVARSNDGAGVSMDWGVSDSSIRDSALTDNGYGWAGGGNPGLYMAWTSAVTVAATDIARNDGNGVMLTNQGMADTPSTTCSTDNVFHRNRFADNGQFGVWLTHSACTGNYSKGNVYEGNGWGPVFEPVCGQFAETAASCTGAGCPNLCAD